ncbi:MAG TPA: GNAT family protein [Puia sp.]|nr:GNAT family protein [Puia sp.]
MIKLEPFTSSDFETFLSWIDSEELLVQIAGHYFSYPLTKEQLHKYLDDEKSISFNVVESLTQETIGHAEICCSKENVYKIDKLIIDATKRGKGIGLSVINELLSYCFEKLDASIVELNVFDWNIAGIKTYKKAGFEINQDKKMAFEPKGKTWIALNMAIDKQNWMKRK